MADATTSTTLSSQDSGESSAEQPATHSSTTKRQSMTKYVYTAEAFETALEKIRHSSVADSHSPHGDYLIDHGEEEAVLDARNTQAAFTGMINGYIHMDVGFAVNMELKRLPWIRPPPVQDEFVSKVQESSYTTARYHNLLNRVADASGVEQGSENSSPFRASSTRTTQRGQTSGRSARFSGEVQVQAFRRRDEPTKPLRTTTTVLEDAEDRRAWLRATARSRAVAKGLARARRPPGRDETLMRRDDRDAVLGTMEDDEEGDSDDADEEGEDTEEDEEG